MHCNRLLDPKTMQLKFSMKSNKKYTFKVLPDCPHLQISVLISQGYNRAATYNIIVYTILYNAVYSAHLSLGKDNSQTHLWLLLHNENNEIIIHT